MSVPLGGTAQMEQPVVPPSPPAIPDKPAERIGESIEGLRPLAQDFNPADLQGTFYGLDEELAYAVPRAALGAAATVNLLAAPIVGALGQEAQDKWFAAMVDEPLRSIEEIDARAMTNGTAAKVVGQFARVAAEAPLGPVGVGVLEAGARTGRELYEGETAEKATALGALSGGTMAVGFALPLSLPVKAGFGPALLQRLGYGVGSNVALGAVQRGGEHSLGEDVEILDRTALALDASLGVLFGGGAHLFLRRGDKVNADAAMTVIEQASAQRIVPPDVPQQAALDHLAARVKAEQTGEAPPPDPPVPPAMAARVEHEAGQATEAFASAEPELARMDESGAGKPLPLPETETPKPAAPTKKADGPEWNPVNDDGDQVDIDLPMLQQTAAQLDALGAKTDDGRTYSEALKQTTTSANDTAALLDNVTRCVLNYGH